MLATGDWRVLDQTGRLLYFSGARGDAVQQVPVYMLYGERHGDLLPEILHAESIAHRSRLHDWEIGTHCHDLFLQVLVVRSGSGVAVIDELEHAFEAPALIVVPPLSIHSFRFAHDIDGDVVTLLAREIDRLTGHRSELTALLASPGFCTWSPGDAQFARLDSALASMLREWRDEGAFRLAALEPLVSVFLVAVARVLLDDTLVSPGATPRAQQTLRRFLELVNRSFDAGNDLGYYARQLGVSTGQLGRVCRATIGKSALEVIHERLLVEAKREIFYSTLSIKQIALGLGFTDAAYFARWFAQRAGMAPSALRARASTSSGAAEDSVVIRGRPAGGAPGVPSGAARARALP